MSEHRYTPEEVREHLRIGTWNVGIITAIVKQQLNDLEVKTAQVEALEAECFEYGYHKRKCVILAEMAGPRPIVSECDCGWGPIGKRLGKARRALDSATEAGDAPPLCAFMADDEICSKSFPHDGDHITAEGAVIGGAASETEGNRS